MFKLFIVTLLFSGCKINSGSQNSLNVNEGSSVSSDTSVNGSESLINPAGNVLNSRIKEPSGYRRIKYDEGSFAKYLQNFLLKKDGTKVYYYNGSEKDRTDVYAAVLDIDTGNKDLQQCADAIMRLRAEYLYEKKEFDKIHFNFTNGFTAGYRKWAEGYRIKVSGSNANWYKSGNKDYSYGIFRNYLEIVFSYAGTLSLSKETVTMPIEELEVGDIFIQGGSPGHAVIVVDVAENDIKEKIFLLAQSYMPAQDIHILNNPVSIEISPWYDLKNTDKLYTPEWTFEKSELKRFTQ